MLFVFQFVEDIKMARKSVYYDLSYIIFSIDCLLRALPAPRKKNLNFD